MPRMPFAPSPASASAWTSTPAVDEYSAATALPMLSSIHNADVSAAASGLPTYQEATNGPNRVMQHSVASAQLHHVSPERDKTIGQWEAEKWRSVSDEIYKFANSPIAAEGNFSAEKVIPAVRAIAKWTNMVKQTPPMMNLGDPYYLMMDGAIADALKQLGSLHNDLLTHARLLRPLNPSCGKHFSDLAARIHVFIQDMN